jgi:hypothetical protein
VGAGGFDSAGVLVTQCVEGGGGLASIVSRHLLGLQTTPVPLNAVAGPGGITLSWEGDGFRVQGAETLAGPWYDLGNSSPLSLPGNSALRVFRLLCD